MQKLIRQLYNNAKERNCCEKFTGNENLEQLLELFQSPQGVEFCQKYQFPDIEILRAFRGMEAIRHGIYIDAGHITLSNVARLTLVGDTVAELRYDDPSKRHEVVLMHGAKAHIEASGYSVVFVTKGGCEVTTEAQDNAKIL